jgi:hypothetical protein
MAKLAKYSSASRFRYDDQVLSVADCSGSLGEDSVTSFALSLEEGCLVLMLPEENLQQIGGKQEDRMNFHRQRLPGVFSCLPSKKAWRNK